MFDDTDRRQFLQLAGTGTALSMAGCSALSNHDGSGAGGEGEPATVTLAVQPDQQSLQELQSEIQSQVQSGEIDRMQAQTLFRERRMELTRDAVGRFRNRSNVSVSVDDTVAQFGVMRVSGDPAALIETLTLGEVSGLFPESAFEEAQSQAQAQGGASTDTSTA
jgi:hypothetical protein